MAFSVGASTVLPALRAFCLFAAAGVAAVYVFQLTFFVACFALDRRRVEARCVLSLFLYTSRNGTTVLMSYLLLLQVKNIFTALQ